MPLASMCILSDIGLDVGRSLDPAPLNKPLSPEKTSCLVAAAVKDRLTPENISIIVLVFLWNIRQELTRCSVHNAAQIKATS